ncbi:MAG: NAD-dependent malic enzyme [Thermodesulfobacteriota bacterium]
MTTVASPGYGFTLRLRSINQPGMVGLITSTIGEMGGDIGAIDITTTAKDTVTRDYTISARGVEHSKNIVDKIRKIEGVEVLNVSDRTFLIHLGGKIKIENSVPLKTRDDLSMAYTPGVARVCEEIARDKSKVYNLTIKRNTVAIVTDGSAVLGLGDIGPEASLPVMEGKCMLFKKFGGVNAFPLALNTKDVNEIVDTVACIAPVFGGINLEDISSPRCFEVEEKLAERLDIPVFHDDQHGTAVVVAAALRNALKVVGKDISEIKIVICGLGAAGISCGQLLHASGARFIVGVDSIGILYKGREKGMNDVKREFAGITNPDLQKGGLAEAMKGADLFIGVSGADILTVDILKTMNTDPVLMALANPNPEIDPHLAGPHVRIMATGRSDFPNQVNNVLCFPGFFKGLLACHATEVNMEMKLAASMAIAAVVGRDELSEDYIIPGVFDERVATRVAEAVIKAAVDTGVARRIPKKRPRLMPENGEEER